jgi:uncharacterized phage infection (PIP) family protein YhgE
MTQMSEASQPITLSEARRRARTMQIRLSANKAPTKTGTRQLIQAVLSLAAQLEEQEQIVQDAQVQREQFTQLINDWNTLFEALNRAGLHLWDEMNNDIVYQWHDGPVIRGFTTWAAAIEAALQSYPR